MTRTRATTMKVAALFMFMAFSTGFALAMSVGGGF
jgi:hypothetical protein